MIETGAHPERAILLENLKNGRFVLTKADSNIDGLIHCAQYNAIKNAVNAQNKAQQDKNNVQEE